MDFSSLVLIEKDKETGFIKRELGSFEVTEGALFVKKLFAIEDEVSLYFDTDKDMEEWEYSAIYDLFNEDVFKDNGFKIEEDLDEYNPTFILKFTYNKDYSGMKKVLDKAVELIQKEMNNVFEAIKGKKAEYEE